MTMFESPIAEASTRNGSEQEVVLARIANLFLRHRVLVLWAPAAAAGIAFIVLLLLGPLYSARATALIQSDQSMSSGLASVAGELGLRLSSTADQSSPSYYAELLQSQDLLERVAAASIPVSTPAGPREVSVMEALDIDAASPEKRVKKTVRELRSRVDIDSDAGVGTLNVTATADREDVAVGLANRLIDELTRFDRQVRHARASAQTRFLQGRLAAADSARLAAQHSLEVFLEQNRRFDQSVGLQNRANRLEREVSLKEQLYLSLAQMLDQARLQEVKDTPPVFLIEHPEATLQQRSRRPFITAIGAFLLTGFLGVSIVLAWEYVTGERKRHEDEYSRLRALARGMIPGFSSKSRAS